MTVGPDAVQPDVLSKPPICPHCKKGTLRAQGHSYQTLMYHPVRYDEEGNRIGRGRNHTSTTWQCAACGLAWTVTE